MFVCAISKVCVDCGEDKALHEFHRDQTKPNGFKTSCKQCRSDYAKVYLAERGGREKTRARYERGREIVLAAKTAPCGDCGQTFPPQVMQFHHTTGEKLFNIGGAKGAYRTPEAIRAEIAKCVVLCANCHILRTWPDLGLGL